MLFKTRCNINYYRFTSFFIHYSFTLTNVYNFCADGSCTLPVDWNGAWLDSEKDSMSFEPAANRITSGWSISAFNNTVSAWTCHNDNATQNYLLFK